MLELALVSDGPGAASYRLLDETARALKRRLEAVRGVDEVTLAGLRRKKSRWCSTSTGWWRWGISPGEVLTAIGNEAQNIPAGSIEAGARRFNVKTSGDYASVEEVRRTVVRSAGASAGAVRVEDVAQVERRDAEASHIARFDGKRAVLLAVNQREGQNVFEVKAALEQELARASAAIPPSIQLQRGFDQSKNVSHRLSGLGRDFSATLGAFPATAWRSSDSRPDSTRQLLIARRRTRAARPRLSMSTDFAAKS